LNLGGCGIKALSSKISRLHNLKYLGLGANSLTSLPEEVGQLRHLASLDLVGNPLTFLPKWIAAIPGLNHLSFGSRELTIAPKWIAAMTKLTSLGVAGGTPVPDWIAEMGWLENLNLGGNDLVNLPDWLFQMANLTALSLDANRFRSLSHSIARLQKLNTLRLWLNELDELPEAIGELPHLMRIDLGGNNLSHLPHSFSRLQRLDYLSLNNNNFASIPQCLYGMPFLGHLSFANSDRWGWNYNLKEGEFSSRNSITKVSAELLRLNHLTRLELYGNPVEVPPQEVVEKGLTAIKDYLRQIGAEGVDHLYEAKLLILGEGGAGKTSLAKKIQNPDYQLDEEKSTQGIDVIRWSFPLDNGRDFKVNIWDFGGQEIYHATHQFFLTKRSLYALVADTRKEDTDFYYWLNIVELLSDNSPVLIVKNEKQDRRREISERQLRGQFAALKETMATNLATNRGLPEILKSIKYYISNLQHVGSPLPRTWVKVREVLEQHSQNYVSLDEYLDICAHNGFSELKDKLQLSGYLHDLGVCLHFQEDPLLRNVVILKPKWGTDAVYKILDNERVIAALGYFTQADLANIWSEPEYANMHQELLRLMINFKLCYQIPGNGNYIAPQLLTENQPAYHWDATDNLVFRYQYEFMPKGIITQLTVAMHPLILHRESVWKSGVILEKDKTRAEVIEHYGRREIQVRVSGKNKRDLMTVVAYELDKIHASYRQLRFSKLVPCNCDRCRAGQSPAFYQLEILRKFVEDSHNRIQCQSSAQMVEVRGLLDDAPAADQRPVGTEVDRGSVVFNAPITTVVIQRTESGDIQMEPKGKDHPKSAWANGLFYLFVFATVITGLGVLAGHVPLYTLALVAVAGMLFILAIGALQLRQDDRLSEKSFMQLIKLVARQLPIIGRIAKSGGEATAEPPPAQPKS
jgi:internalin A